MTVDNPLPGDRLSAPQPASFILEPPPRENPPWDVWDVAGLLVVAVIALAAATLATLVVVRQFGIFHGEKITQMVRDARVAVPAQAVAYAAIVAFMYAIVRRRGAMFWKALKWNWPRGWFGYLWLGIGVALFVQLFASELPMPRRMPIDELFRNATSAYILMVFGTTAAPLVEELFFRGFLYPVLERGLERWTRAGAVALAVVLTAAPFALMHAGQVATSWAPLVVLFVVGLALTVVRAKRESLAASVLTHAGYNLTLFVMMWFATDHFQHLEKLAR